MISKRNIVMTSILIIINLAMVFLQATGQEVSAVAALRLFDREDYEEAEKLFRILLNEDPDNTMLNYYYGACRTENGNFSEADLNYLLKAGKTVTPHRINYYLGIQYHASGDWEQALKFYNQFRISVPENEQQELKINEKIQQCYDKVNPFGSSYTEGGITGTTAGTEQNSSYSASEPEQAVHSEPPQPGTAEEQALVTWPSGQTDTNVDQTAVPDDDEEITDDAAEAGLQELSGQADTGERQGTTDKAFTDPQKEISAQDTPGVQSGITDKSSIAEQSGITDKSSIAEQSETTDKSSTMEQTEFTDEPSTTEQPEPPSASQAKKKESQLGISRRALPDLPGVKPTVALPEGEFIEFQINSSITYLHTSHFMTDKGKELFEQYHAMQKKLNKNLEQAEMLRKEYRQSDDENMKKTIGQEILSLENETYGMQDIVRQLRRGCREAENEYWQSADKTELNNFMLELNKIRALKEGSYSDAMATDTRNDEPIIIIDPSELLLTPDISHGRQQAPELVYKIQIGAYSRGVPSHIRRLYNKLEMLRRIDNYTDEEGVVVYTTGNLTNLEDAMTMRDQVRQEGIKDAQVVPYFQGKRITLEHAKEIEAGR
ncbi:MAG: hypothetical protein PHG29_06380 [Prolixibacteraceae bacterium]|nr:hypothetical protein [Prolixibacteraceae bacterium]